MSGSTAVADDADEIDQSVDEALERFRTQVKGASDYLSAANGVLVIPEVKKMGLVLAGQWGEGALRIGKENTAYYKMNTGSLGFQGGYQEADFVFVFFTDKALDDFRRADKWTVGAESGITIVEKGFGGSVDTLKSQNPVAGFAFGKKGLMAGWSLKGTKFTRFTPK
ncbi:MAG: YSC84-related protein [Myxococcales bacterium]